MGSGRLEIVVWNVEHGAAILVNTPNDRIVLLDAGASDDFSPAEWLSQRHKVSSSHLMILSHADADHIRDIEKVDCLIRPAAFFRNKTVPDNLVYPTMPPQTNPLKYYYEVFNRRYTQDVLPGSPLAFNPVSNWGGVRIAPFYIGAAERVFGKLNDYSVATWITLGHLKFLFPGDLEAPGWEALFNKQAFRDMATPGQAGEVRILVAAHHGRKHGVYKPFLDHYKPHISIISDHYGVEHTDAETYRQASLGYPVWHSGSSAWDTRYTISTKMNNFVLIATDGSDVRIIGEGKR